MQGLGRATFHALHAKDALRSQEPLPGRVDHIHVHRTNLPARPAGNAFIRIVFDAEQREIGGWLQEDGDGAKILAESPVVVKRKGQKDSGYVVDEVADDKTPEHDARKVRHMDCLLYTSRCV